MMNGFIAAVFTPLSNAFIEHIQLDKVNSNQNTAK